ncbi:hypothetical protein [Burkholderia gladioli]|uniref:hypothetical protein n=1 Tax=Burkholderia gladioli TaxID=28095 RepID=UPI0009B80969|nr:hypothetical protein [Burkholderia gladioli]ASD83830.1 hypothetical protein CEJ98_33965 [Burkholderia gladioli pv. gladioli]AWY51253.1 hypothetical protein A8H28_08730 [Burkholderia gladioli pv. gladioli]MBU9188064.1 hypothetical protein [Burkholderia gladioli]MBU9320954.1 hypothetical protein [Burkholderia gladioli]MBU9683305.1 hypothetical protein [Burkholderia gladioli]
MITQSNFFRQTTSISLLIFMTAYAEICLASASVNCETLNYTASKNGDYIAGEEAGRTVIGRGRLQFYSAPDYSCEVKGIFILPNESVEAYTSYRGFTSVAYLNSRQSKPVLGWVQSSRLAPNGLGIAPVQKTPTESKEQ